jgi:hypothetical protein
MTANNLVAQQALVGCGPGIAASDERSTRAVRVCGSRGNGIYGQAAAMAGSCHTSTNGQVLPLGGACLRRSQVRCRLRPGSHLALLAINRLITRVPTQVATRKGKRTGYRARSQ